MRRLLIAFGLLAAAAIVGTVMTRHGDDSRSVAAGQQTVASSPTTVASGPVVSDAESTVSKSGVAGARQAAVDAVAMTGEVVRAGFISRRDLVASFATDSFAPVLADRTSQDVNAMLLELGKRGVDPSTLAVRELPVSAIAQPTPAGATVMVWSVLVIAVAGTGPGRQLWRTVTLQIVDVSGRWLVNGWSSSPGPTPSPIPDVSFDDAATVVGRLGWEPATVSVRAA